MKAGKAVVEPRDILCNGPVAFAVFCIPICAIIASGILKIGDGPRAVVWTIALSTMAAGCLSNAARCGRIHCFVTGPFFLLTALLSALYGLSIVHLGPNGWNTIGLTVLVGGVALTYLPEMFFGKYRRRRE